MRTLFAHSDDPDSSDAVAAILSDCRARLAGAAPKAGLLFCSVEYDHATILGAIQREWPGLPVIGSSSDGELSSSLGSCDDSVLLTLFYGDDVRAHAGVGRGLASDIQGAIAEALAGRRVTKPALCITTFAPSTNAAEVIRELSRQLGRRECPIVGGLSGDHREYARTTEYFGTEALTDSVPVLLLEGDFAVSWGIGSGWFPLGDRHVVTRSNGHEVLEIAGIPALEFYRREYGDVPTDSLGEFPLALYDGQGRMSLRAIIGRDEATGSLRFTGEVPEGAEVQVTQVLEQGLLEGSKASLGVALDRFAGSRPELALVFSCAARKWVLGPDASQEVEVFRRLAADRGLQELAFVGLYCFGEVAPTSSSSRDSGFHNETCVSVVIGPR